MTQVVQDVDALTERLRSRLRPDDVIVMSQAAAEPAPLLEALHRAASAARGGTLYLATRIGTTFPAGLADELRLVGLGGFGANRSLVDAGVLDIAPLHLAGFARAIRRGEQRVDVALVQVSPADPQGRHSLGLDASYTAAAIASARLVVAEVNARMPATAGHRRIDPEQLDLVLATDRPLPEFADAEPSRVELRIAELAVPLIPDQATLQVGLGRAPRAVCRHLFGRRDLQLHTGLLDDAQFELVRNGAAQGARTVAGVIAGSARLYAEVGDAGVQVRDAEQTHGLAVLAALPRFTSVGTALQIDLTGQVNAEVIGGRSVGAVAGLGDFVRGAALSEGGRSLLLLPSTARGGAVSRIVSQVEAVTVPRSDVDVVVTEHGVAELRHATLPERAARLIAIAAPQHRPALSAAQRR